MKCAEPVCINQQTGQMVAISIALALNKTLLTNFSVSIMVIQDSKGNSRKDAWEIQEEYSGKEFV